MRHPAMFDVFMEQTINLNSTRLKRLEEKTAVVERQLRASSYKPKILDVSTKGSYVHRTIIKPPKTRHSFDADMVVYLDKCSGWSAKDYVDRLYFRLKEIPHYSRMVKRKSRCVTIDYADDFHIDIVPVVVNRTFFTGRTFTVCNRNEDKFERTDGSAFDVWWEERDAILGGSQLVEVTRVMKYLRDIKGRFSCKSILLTTLIGQTVRDSDRGGFSDLPSAFKTLVGRLDDFLSANADMPLIANPVLSEENFNRHWDDEKYSTFRSRISQYREWIDDAYDEEDPQVSVKKWRRVLGDEFGKNIDLSSPEFISETKANELIPSKKNKNGILLITGAALAVLLALK